MKSLLATLAFAIAHAQQTTDNDCFEEEGATYQEGCRDLFYKMCDKFFINIDDSCNVITYGNAAVSWFSKDITVKYWEYMNQFAPPPSSPEEPVDNNDWADWNWRLRAEDPGDQSDWSWQCLQNSEIPEGYDVDKDLQARRGVCGFKFQIINTSTLADFSFTVLRDNALSLAVPLFASAAATLTLF